MTVKWKDIGIIVSFRPLHNHGLSLHNNSKNADKRILGYHPWSLVQVYLGPLLVTVTTGLVGSNVYKGE